MPGCEVLYCISKRRIAYEQWTGHSISYHRFPLKQGQHIAEKWVENINRSDFKLANVLRWSRVCSRHFKPEDFVKRHPDQPKRLKPEAVPTVFEDYPKHLQPVIIKHKSVTCNSASTSAWKCGNPKSVYPKFFNPEINAKLVQQDHSYCSTKGPKETTQALRLKIRTAQQKIRRQLKKIEKLKREKLEIGISKAKSELQMGI